MLNKRLSTMSMLKLLLDAKIIPTLLNIDHFEESMQRIVSATN